MNKYILIIDDELLILNSLTQLFSNAGYRVFTALNDTDAFKILDSEKIGLVISDLRISGTDGYDLLRKIKMIYPDIFRIIMSCQADEKIVLKALALNIAKLCVYKPWNDRQLLNTVDSVFATGETLKCNDLLTHINNLESLPAIGTNYQRILNLTDNDSEIKDIADEIEKDQSIALKVLHIANSSYYGISTGSVRQAILFLGLNNVRNLILSTSIMDLFNDKTKNIDKINSMWRHAFVSNRMVQYIYEKILYEILPDNCKTAGLLHNVGEIYFLKFYQKLYLEIILLAEEKGLNKLKSEKDIFGLTHCEVGAYLLQWWELPFPIVESALYHHAPLNKKVMDKKLICAMHITDRYASVLLGEKMIDDFYQDAFSVLGISKTELERRLLSFKV